MPGDIDIGMTLASKAQSYNELSLLIPSDFHQEFVAGLDSLVSRSDVRAPFRRQVDLWWYAIGVGVKAGTRTPLPTPQSKHFSIFNQGAVLYSNRWRITHLELLVLGEQGEEATSNPGTVILTANEYALTGFRFLTEELRGHRDLQMHLLSRIS